MDISRVQDARSAAYTAPAASPRGNAGAAAGVVVDGSAAAGEAGADRSLSALFIESNRILDEIIRQIKAQFTPAVDSASAAAQRPAPADPALLQRAAKGAYNALGGLGASLAGHPHIDMSA